MIPNLPRAGAKCGHLAKAAPAPQCPVSVASRIHAVGEMNHLLLWPGLPLIVCVKALLWGRSATPPFLCRYLYPAAALGSTSSHSVGPNIRQPDTGGKLVFRALWQLSLPFSGRTECQRRKWGCEGSHCFHGTNRDGL